MSLTMASREARYKVVGISDVSIGYGSPEVPALMHSLCKMLRTQGLLIEPDEIARPPVRMHWGPAFDLYRVSSPYPDHTPAWENQFLGKAVDLVAQNDPDVLIIFGAPPFAALMALAKWPNKVIYHAYELISALPPHHLDAHRHLLGRVDLVITPEINRLIVDVEAIGTYPVNVAAIYNVADVSYPEPVLHRPADQRNGRFVWYGTLHRRQAFADYFFSTQIRDIGIDIFGRITDPQAAEVGTQIRKCTNLRYFGVVPGSELNERRAHNTFSILWWNPELNAGAYYLASNRFFTSLQAGLPVICGPHPQCVDLVNRYGCGLVMNDWSFTSFEETLREAMLIYDSPIYPEMVEGCISAAKHDLNWEVQFERIAPRIREALQLQSNTQ